MFSKEKSVGKSLEKEHSVAVKDAEKDPRRAAAIVDADTRDTRENQERRAAEAPKPNLVELLHEVAQTFKKTDNGLHTELWHKVEAALLAHGGQSASEPTTIALPPNPEQPAETEPRPVP